MSANETAGSDAAPQGDAGYWLSLIERAQKTDGYRKWADRCAKIRKKFRYEGSSDTANRKYQILWSNFQTMAPAVYSKAPKPTVSRRWKDKDPVGRAAAQMLERAIAFQLDLNGWHDQFKAVRDDFLLYARGAVRLKYEPIFDTVRDDEGELDTQAMQGDAAETQEEQSEAKQPGEVLSFENVQIQFLQREDFVIAPARTWAEVPWVAFRAFMTRDELVERFGDEIGGAIPLDASPTSTDSDQNGGQRDNDPADQKAIVWEIWHKPSRTVIWAAKGAPNVLERSEPYLRLEGFFPAPKPAFGTLTNDELNPIPDYVYYQDQAEEIDDLTQRIGHLTDQLKIAGLYPSGASDVTSAIERIAKPGVENVLIPIPNWAQFKEGGGSGGSIEWWPVDKVITVLEGCVKLRQQLIEDVNQIFGLSDIMRGDGDASETATAQSIKAQYGSVRIRDRQDELARFCADVSAMAGEIIATHFQPNTIMQMANMPLPTRQDVEMAQQQAAIQAQQAAQQQAQQQQAMMAQQAQQMPPQGAQPPMGPQ